MTTDDLVSETEAARMLGLSVRTLQAQRVRGGGCRFVKLGRAIRYRPSDIAAFIDARVVTSTTEADSLRGAA